MEKQTTNLDDQRYPIRMCLALVLYFDYFVAKPNKCNVRMKLLMSITSEEEHFFLASGIQNLIFSTKSLITQCREFKDKKDKKMISNPLMILFLAVTFGLSELNQFTCISQSLILS